MAPIDAAALSHELRGPLHTILTLSELLHEQPEGPVELRRQLADHICVSARELLEVLNGLIALTRARSAQELPEIAPVAMHDVVQATIHGLRAARPTARVEALCPPSLPVLATDAQLVRQLLTALSEHALRSSGSCANVTFACANPGPDAIAISVTHPRPVLRTPRSAQSRANLALQLSQALAGLLGSHVAISESGEVRTLSVTLHALPTGSGSQ